MSCFRLLAQAIKALLFTSMSWATCMTTPADYLTSIWWARLQSHGNKECSAYTYLALHSNNTHDSWWNSKKKKKWFFFHSTLYSSSSKLTLPTMQLKRWQFSRRFGWVMLAAANDASCSRVWYFLPPHPLLLFFLGIQTCSPQPHPTLAQVTSMDAINQSSYKRKASKVFFTYVALVLLMTCKHTLMCKIGGVSCTFKNNFSNYLDKSTRNSSTCSSGPCPDHVEFSEDKTISLHLWSAKPLCHVNIKSSESQRTAVGPRLHSWLLVVWRKSSENCNRWCGGHRALTTVSSAGDRCEEKFNF